MLSTMVGVGIVESRRAWVESKSSIITVIGSEKSWYDSKRNMSESIKEPHK